MITDYKIVEGFDKKLSGRVSSMWETVDLKRAVWSLDHRLSRQDQLRTRVFTINEGRFMMRAPECSTQLKGKDCFRFPQGQTPRDPAT